MIVYSSGSTAAPKGAVHSHGAVVRHAFAMSRAYELRPEDRLYSPMPFFWVGGLVTSLLSPMHAGACVLTEEAFEPGRTLDLLERERATVVIGWPHFAKSMAEHPSFAARDLSSIRRGSLYELVSPALRPADPGLRSNSLGMTETCGPHTVGDGRVDLPESLRGTFGRAVPGVEHKIVDPESGRSLAPGETGEICVRGYSLMQGLYKLERADVFDPDGFYHTADGGYFDADGWLFFQGRLGDLIKTAGANVAPAEVEAALVRQPGVAEAYATGIPDRDRGELVAAAVVPAAGASLDATAMLARLRGELSSYKVPRRLLVCAKSDLPFTDSGKIRRKDLAQLLARDAVEPRAQPRDPEPPRDSSRHE
jgi:acyl-CoA synthetase (AMP-forming)/AMP-acid ligase II